MSEWWPLKRYDFEDREVKISRSRCALRKWKVETYYKYGETKALETEDEKDAWHRFCNECAAAIYDMEARRT